VEEQEWGEDEDLAHFEQGAVKLGNVSLENTPTLRRGWAQASSAKLSTQGQLN
jgi:hypothetical protein